MRREICKESVKADEDSAKISVCLTWKVLLEFFHAEDAEDAEDETQSSQNFLPNLAIPICDNVYFA